ncbi:MAG TPA: hypothetical protein VHF67_00965 [Gaiellaceae bacterium]|nr:hypothetical protein [Gaiellaceae bacterium]
MRFYPHARSERLATLVQDALVVALLVLFAWLALKVHDAIDELAVLGEGVEGAGAAVERGFGSAAEAVDGAPVIGDDLAGALRDAGEGTGGEAVEIGRESQEQVRDTADLAGLVTFLVPAALLLFQAVPARMALVRRLTAADRALAVDDPERRRLVAMRAAFSLPYDELLRYTRDPFGDLAEGRYDALVTAALTEAGLGGR